jgi:hypothetical protein
VNTDAVQRLRVVFTDADQRLQVITIRIERVYDM